MRRSPLLASPTPDRTGEPGYREWHAPISGPCVICGRRGSLQRHHVILEQHLRVIDVARVWDLAGSLLIGIWCPERCHRRHHNAFRRIPASKLSATNLGFMLDVLGEDRAALYIVRHYAVG